VIASNRSDRRHAHHRQRSHAFALAELVTLVVILAVVFCLATIASSHQRRLARIGEDLAHLRQIAAATSSFQADNTDLIWGFSWRAGVVQSTPWGDLNGPPSNDTDAAGAQMCFIARTYGGRTAPETPRIANFWPYANYSHLALLPYLNQSCPSRVFAAASDELTKWVNDPRGYDQGLYTPNYGTGGGPNWRHPYRSSFTIGTAFYDQSPIGGHAYPASYSSVNIPSNNVMRQQALSSVAHPSQKVLVNDRLSRYYLKQLWHMDPQSRATALFVDGSAGIRAFAEANHGADPNNPNGPPVQIQYVQPRRRPRPHPTGGRRQCHLLRRPRLDPHAARRERLRRPRGIPVTRRGTGSSSLMPSSRRQSPEPARTRQHSRSRSHTRSPEQSPRSAGQRGRLASRAPRASPGSPRRGWPRRRRTQARQTD
jgi:hypothetical protein